LREFGDWTNGPTGSILKTPNSTNKFRLVQFLSGGGSASAAAAATSPKIYANYSGTLLGSTVGIVKNYFKVPANGGVASYTYPTTAPLLADTKLWNSTDINSATYDLIATPTSIIGNLMKNEFLLKPNQIFVPGSTRDFSGTPTSLFQIYAIENSAGELTTAQKSTKTMLESTNMRFFGAFFIEYCYYRSRYSALLDLYFNVFITPPENYIAPTGDMLNFLFVSSGTGDNKYTGTASNTVPTQADYLKVITYHLACLNTRLVDMRRLLTKVNSLYSAYYTELQNTLNDRNNNSNSNGSTKSVTDALTALNTSAEDTQDYLSEADYRKGVMDYASEKNRYSNILLGVYAFLNLSALAVVIYSM
jgi:hypothetical protein